MDELTIGDKTYISSKHAAKITGYAKDYVGQLCREGRVEARLVGRNWYVLEPSIREHRFGKEESQEKPEEAPRESVTASWEPPRYHSVPESPALPPITPVESRTEPSGAADTSQIVSDMQSAWKEWFETRQPVSESAEEPLPGDEEEAVRITKEVATDIEEEQSVAEEEDTNTSDMTNIEAIFGGPLVHSARQEEEDEDPEMSFESEEEEPATPQRTPVIPDLPQTSTSRGVVDLSRPQPVISKQPSYSAYKPAKPVPARNRGRASVVMAAVFWSVAGLSLTVMLIGSGMTDELLSRQGQTTGIQGAVLNVIKGESVYEAKR